MAVSIVDIAALREHRAAGRDLAGVILVGLDLTSAEDDLLLRTKLDGALLLGCRLTPASRARADAAGALLFPDIPDLPYRVYRSSLYSPGRAVRRFRRRPARLLCGHPRRARLPVRAGVRHASGTVARVGTTAARPQHHRGARRGAGGQSAPGRGDGWPRPAARLGRLRPRGRARPGPRRERDRLHRAHRRRPRSHGGRTARCPARRCRPWRGPAHPVERTTVRQWFVHCGP